MNRFQESELYQGKNSLVANFLSHCDLYRPRFFLLENIEDLIKYKGGLVLRLCVRALTKMGYQVAFSVLQAGQYGVPQSRKRLFILATGPGESLVESQLRKGRLRSGTPSVICLPLTGRGSEGCPTAVVLSPPTRDS